MKGVPEIAVNKKCPQKLSLSSPSLMLLKELMVFPFWRSSSTTYSCLSLVTKKFFWSTYHGF